MRPLKLAILPVLAIALIGSTATANQVEGIWINPHGTVAVQTGACGARLCGRVVWASAEAMADARDGGVNQLIGTQLLQNYKPTGAGTWSGRVFVPDMGRTFSSTIRQLGPNSLKIQGCLIGGFICKSQTWRRR